MIAENIYMKVFLTRPFLRKYIVQLEEEQIHEIAKIGFIVFLIFFFFLSLVIKI
jgi:hypothetical protein